MYIYMYMYNVVTNLIRNLIIRNYFLDNQRRKMRWARNVARMGIKLNAYRVLVRNPRGRTTLVSLRRRY